MTVTVDIGSLLKVLGPLLAVAAVLYFLYQGWRKVYGWWAGRKFSGNDRSQFARRWQEIESLASREESSRRMAIVEADKLLDHALKAIAMPGETLGERLKFAQYKYPNLRDVWFAHRLRNQLVHEANYHLDASNAKKALKSFRKALEMLGAI